MSVVETIASGGAHSICAPRRSGRHYFWSAREEKILRSLYPSGGVPACLDALPERSDKAIYMHAHALGLHKPGWVKDFSYHRFKANDQIDGIIRRAYGDAKKGSIAECARVLNRPRWWVSQRASRLGLVAPRFKEPPWTEAEDDLVSTYAHLSPRVLARRMSRSGFRRTATAIAVRLKRLGHPSGRNADVNRFTAGGLAKVMGVDAKTVTRWVTNGFLKAERRGTARTAVQGGDEYAIHRRDVRKFVIENAAAVDLRKVDKFWFIEMMAERS